MIEKPENYMISRERESDYLSRYSITTGYCDISALMLLLQLSKVSLHDVYETIKDFFNDTLMLRNFKLLYIILYQ